MPRRTFAKDRIYAGAMLNASRVLKRNLYPTSTFEILEQSQIKAVLLQRERERERETEITVMVEGSPWPHVQHCIR